jgi:hypothetical protein
MPSRTPGGYRRSSVCVSCSLLVEGCVHSVYPLTSSRSLDALLPAEIQLGRDLGHRFPVATRELSKHRTSTRFLSLQILRRVSDPC